MYFFLNIHFLLELTPYSYSAPWPPATDSKSCHFFTFMFFDYEIECKCSIFDEVKYEIFYFRPRQQHWRLPRPSTWPTSAGRPVRSEEEIGEQGKERQARVKERPAVATGGRVVATGGKAVATQETPAAIGEMAVATEETLVAVGEMPVVTGGARPVVAIGKSPLAKRRQLRGNRLPLLSQRRPLLRGRRRRTRRPRPAPGTTPAAPAARRRRRRPSASTWAVRAPAWFRGRRWWPPGRRTTGSCSRRRRWRDRRPKRTMRRWTVALRGEQQRQGFGAAVIFQRMYIV